MVDAVTANVAPATSPPDPTDGQARDLIAQNTRFGQVDAKGLAQAVANSPTDGRPALAGQVSQALKPADQGAFVSELTVLAKAPADDGRPHSLMDHLSDAGGVLWGAVKDLGHLAGGVARTGYDLSLGPTVDAAREATGLVTGHTPQAPSWAPLTQRGVDSVVGAGKVAYTAATHPGAVVDALKAPYQKDIAEGRWGALAAQAVVDFGGLLDGESEAVDAAKIGRVAEDVAKTTDLAKAADLSKASDLARTGDVAKTGETLDQAGATSSKATNAAEALTKVTSTEGKNTVTWSVNADGRGVEARATLKEAFDGADRSSTENKLTEEVGNSGGRSNDDGGHMIAHRFMLDQGEKNMFPQNSNFNRGAYKTMENEWAAWTKAGGEVKVDVKLNGFDAAGRPEKVSVTYSVTDPDTGKTLYKNAQRFNNEAGQTFERVSAADIAKLMGK